jgi:hypothetical protein
MTPECSDRVVAGMTLAFNPAIAGVRVEDTVMVGQDGVEILTSSPGWPEIRIAAEGSVYELAGILIRPAGSDK